MLPRFKCYSFNFDSVDEAGPHEPRLRFGGAFLRRVKRFAGLRRGSYSLAGKEWQPRFAAFNNDLHNGSHETHLLGELASYAKPKTAATCRAGFRPDGVSAWELSFI